MSQSGFRIVLDTNTLLRGLVVADSASAKVRRAAEHRTVIPLLSKSVLDEYRHVLGDRDMRARFPELTGELIEVAMRRLRFVSDYVRFPKVEFDYQRDPRDQKFIELAISLNATHIITHDQDLLALPTSRTDAGRRFRQRLPTMHVMTAAQFVRRHLNISSSSFQP